LPEGARPSFLCVRLCAFTGISCREDRAERCRSRSSDICVSKSSEGQSSGTECGSSVVSVTAEFSFVCSLSAPSRIAMGRGSTDAGFDSRRGEGLCGEFMSGGRSSRACDLEGEEESSRNGIPALG